MTGHRFSKGPRGRWLGGPAACSAVTVASLGIICASTGPVMVIAGLSLLASLAGALWLAYQARPDAVAASVGLTLAFLILAGLALAAIHALSTVPTALVVAVTAVAAAWISVWRADPEPVASKARPRTPGLAVAGALVFAAAAVLAVHYAAASATADNAGASSLAIWAYPSGGRLHVGAQQPAGRGSTSLRIVVTQAGVTAAVWNNIRLAPGQTWEAPALTLTGNGQVRVTALAGGAVVASLSTQAAGSAGP